MTDIKKIKELVEYRLLAAQSELAYCQRGSSQYTYCESKIAGIQEILIFGNLDKEGEIK